MDGTVVDEFVYKDDGTKLRQEGVLDETPVEKVVSTEGSPHMPHGMRVFRDSNPEEFRFVESYTALGKDICVVLIFG